MSFIYFFSNLIFISGARHMIAFPWNGSYDGYGNNERAQKYHLQWDEPCLRRKYWSQLSEGLWCEAENSCRTSACHTAPGCWQSPPCVLPYPGSLCSLLESWKVVQKQAWGNTGSHTPSFPHTLPKHLLNSHTLSSFIVMVQPHK